jgi:hypothetical protein
MGIEGVLIFSCDFHMLNALVRLMEVLNLETKKDVKGF